MKVPTRLRLRLRLLVSVAAVGAAQLLVTNTHAQGAALPYGVPIGIDAAQRIAARAVEEARRNNWRLAVAVVDTHGFLVHFVRMDDTQTAGVVIAQEKARTAAMFRRPSRVFEEGLPKRLAYLSLPGATAVIGGLPIIVDGRIVGGIGASGAASEDDEAAVKAGLQALARP